MRLAGRINESNDERDDILELVLDRIGRRVSAPAPAAPIDAGNGKMPLELRSNGIPVGMVDARAVNEHQRRAFPPPLICDFCPVPGNEILHIIGAPTGASAA